MPLALDLIYLLALLACAPYLAWKSWRTGKYREGFREKLLGRAPRRVGDAPCVWFHAVSVGEVLALRPVVDELTRRRPGWDVVISTTTPTGLAVARKTFPDLVTFFAPLDFSWAVRRAVTRIRPTVLALVELEVWPNLIRAVKAAGAAVAVVNGRLSVRSARGYGRLGRWIRPSFVRLDLVAAQTPEYAERFLTLGVAPNRVKATGSIKYDGLEADRNHPRTLELRRLLGLKPSEVVFVAGSTMEGEEAAALRAYRAARVDHPGLRLVIVPRHPHRFDEVAALLEGQGETVARRSRLGAGAKPSAEGIILVDTLGELGAVWGLADLAYVGGSLYPGRGGQNMMEPAAFGAAVFFGPHTSNFRATVEALLDRDAAEVVHGPEGLEHAIQRALVDPESAAGRGARARAFVLAQRGAASRTVAELDQLVRAVRPSPSSPGRVLGPAPATAGLTMSAPR